MPLIRSIIVDDEDLARLNVREALRDFPHWQVVKEYANGQFLLDYLGQHPVDVVFLDIQMPGIDGLQLARQIIKLPGYPLIIFVTAYDRYAVEAFDLFALDYLLKPFDDQRFQRSILRAEQALISGQHRKPMSLWSSYTHLEKHQRQPLQQLVIRSVGTVRLVSMDDVYWFAASGNYVEVHHSEGMHLHRVSLSYLEQQLDSSVFFRVHRSAVVKRSEIREFQTLADDQYRVLLRNGTQVKVSVRYKDELLRALGITG